MNPEIVKAAAGPVTSWALWGISMAQLNEALQAIAFIAATFCSIAAGLYYLSKRKKP